MARASRRRAPPSRRAPTSPLSESTSPRSTTSSTPRRYGGAIRGNGWRPSITSSSAVSSPYRYSVGPSTTSIVDAVGPARACSISSIAARRRSQLLGRTCAFVAMTISVGADRERGDQRALEHRVRVGAQDRPVLERARARPRPRSRRRSWRAPGAVGGDRPPLAPGREAGAAAAAETGGVDLVDHDARLDGSSRGQARAASRTDVLVERRTGPHGQNSLHRGAVPVRRLG